MEFDMNMNNIFLDFIYDRKTINVSRTQYSKFFEDENLDPTMVTPANLLYVAKGIANSMSTIEDGIKFMSFCIIVASYILNKKGN